MFKRQRMSEQERVLQTLAEEELERYNRRMFFDHGVFNWFEFPLRQPCLDALVAASLSHRIGCKGGLINERGRPNGRLHFAAQELRRAGYLGKENDQDEFQPTKLGWAMLERFAPERACFPSNYERQLPNTHQLMSIDGERESTDGTRIRKRPTAGIYRGHNFATRIRR